MDLIFVLRWLIVAIIVGVIGYSSYDMTQPKPNTFADRASAIEDAADAALVQPDPVVPPPDRRQIEAVLAKAETELRKAPLFSKDRTFDAPPPLPEPEVESKPAPVAGQQIAAPKAVQPLAPPSPPRFKLMGVSAADGDQPIAHVRLSGSDAVTRVQVGNRIEKWTVSEIQNQ